MIDTDFEQRSEAHVRKVKKLRAKGTKTRILSTLVTPKTMEALERMALENSVSLGVVIDALTTSAEEFRRLDRHRKALAKAERLARANEIVMA